MTVIAFLFGCFAGYGLAILVWLIAVTVKSKI
jgi:hypothetical protein